jgi:GNAT superfamily N-acetyltransferase
MLTPADEAAASETSAAPEKGSALLMTRTGFTFYVRPVAPDDGPALADFFAHVTPEDMRFRFLSSLARIDRDRLDLMTNVDHDRTEHFLAFDLGEKSIIATAMIAADPAMEKAEVAVSVRSDCQNRGIGWAMLKHLARYAEDRDIGCLTAIESQANTKGIELEREMGFTARPCPGDSTMVLLEARLGGGA